MTQTSVNGVYGVSPAELSRRVGVLAQVARIDAFTEDQGPARGSRRVRLVTGGGLEVELHPDRALDIGQVTYRGVSVAWMSPTGITAPSFYEASASEWLRTFGGGLLVTCGLDTFGPSSVDKGVEYPMHGRISAVPATVTRSEIVDGVLTVSGEVRQAKVFGENLLLRRTITADIGGSSLRVHDTITNEGLADAGIMVLYHCNIGWPLLDERATLTIPSREVSPRDADAESGVARWDLVEEPQAGYAEQVFRHDFQNSGTAVVSIDNPAVGIRLELLFDSATLPSLHQWKMSGEGHYVMGLEPTNANWNFGRASAREAGVLPILERGDSVSYSLEFAFGASQES